VWCELDCSDSWQGSMTRFCGACNGASFYINIEDYLNNYQLIREYSLSEVYWLLMWNQANKLKVFN